jgi:hypothetical protein
LRASRDFDRGRRIQALQQLRRVRTHEQQGAHRRTQKALADHAVQHGDQQVVIAIGVQQAEGLAVHTELVPGPDLKQFFKRANATRQRHKGIGALEHQSLALVHGFNHM